MHIYFSYNSVPELTSVPRAERKAVIGAAARSLAATAEGRSQFRLFFGWLFFAAVSSAFIFFISHASTKLPGGSVTIVTGVIWYLSYTFVFQFQVQRLRPHITAILSTEPNVEQEWGFPRKPEYVADTDVLHNLKKEAP